MDRATFEQLVSEWLAEADRRDLGGLVAAAAAHDPELAKLRAQWVRLDELLRQPPAALARLDWDRVKARLSVALDQSADAAQAEARLDEQLRALAAAEPRVNWPVFQRRIRATVEDDVANVRRVRRIGWRVSAVTGMLAAAAALMLLLGQPPHLPRPTTGLRGVARVHVLPPGAGAIAADSRHGVARVFVIEQTDTESSKPGVPSPTNPTPEVFFMLEPPALLAMASAGGPGAH